MDNKDAAKILRGLVTIDRLRLLRPEMAAINQAADALDIAPALLAALERIANSCEEFATDPQCDADPYDLCEAMAQDARAAIAAARGEG